MKLYHHPISSYSQKALVALYEKQISFSPVIVHIMKPEARLEYRKVYALGKVPYLVLDDGTGIGESSAIIEHVDLHYSTGPRLVPEDRDLAIRARQRERAIDLYVNDSMGKVFFDGMRPESERDPRGVRLAKETLDIMYRLMDEKLAGQTWALGDAFSVVDCAAAPALGYARFAYPYAQYENLTAYFNRLAERPSYQRVLAEAEPYMKMFGG